MKRANSVDKSRTALSLTLGGLALTALVGFFVVDYKGLDVGAAGSKFFSDIFTMLTQPGAKHFTLAEALAALGTTLCLGFLTTFIGGILALIAGPFASRNLSPPRIVGVLKGFVALIRAVPTVLWVLIFAIGAGLGSVAAVVGMSFHSFGYLLKAYSESFEEIDAEVIEALRAAGASWPQIVAQAVYPSSRGSLIAWTFLRFEINFTNAVAMGAAAGAGGIGYQLFMSSGFYFDIHEVGYITWLILAVAVGLEAVAIRVKDSQRVVR
jgi:phosphonate transport system permease protein